MNHHDHVALIRAGVLGNADTATPADDGARAWADFGSGTGAFTLALADVLGPGAAIHSVERDRSALREQERAMHARFPDAMVQFHHADFTRPLNLPPLDGIVMANALHFFPEKQSVLAQVRAYLRPGGRFILVEYDTDRGNRWVPFPLSYRSWVTVAGRAGFAQTHLLATVPSRFLGAIYAAVSE